MSDENLIPRTTAVHRRQNSLVKIHRRGVNFDNIISIPTTKAHPYTRLTVGYSNARSVSNKTQEIHDFISEEKLDVMCISETRMTGTQLDDLLCNEL